jgi:aromatic ring-opening dioxygenase catalytic subunit (LigB family)
MTRDRVAAPDFGKNRTEICESQLEQSATLLSIPTPDHYLPTLYVIATRQQGEIITFPIEGVGGGPISMLTVQVG